MPSQRVEKNTQELHRFKPDKTLALRSGSRHKDLILNLEYIWNWPGSRSGHMPTSLTQKISLIDNYFQMKK